MDGDAGGIHRRNKLLSALEQDDFARVASRLEIVRLPIGRVICDSGEPLHQAYFPHDSIVSLTAVLSDGGSAEMAVFGREGVLGYASAFVTREAFGRYAVEVPGTASSIQTDRLLELVEAMPALRQVLRRYIEALFAQSFQTIACNALHNVEERCGRWILTFQDRLDRDDLPITHDYIARTLSVQRSTVSLTLRTFQRAGLIEQRRGGIRVVDRAGLKETACECYTTVRQRYQRLLPQTYK